MRYPPMDSLKNILIFFLTCISIWSCIETTKKSTHLALQKETILQKSVINPEGKTIEERFNTPDNYNRVILKENHFGSYLRKLPLKPIASKVMYFDGRAKNNMNVYISVVDMEIGTRDLQQCADAVMRLRGEFLFEQQRLQDIHFTFVSDGKPRYFLKYAKGDYSYKKFRRYMNYIFAYANTASLRKELQEVTSIKDIQVGDVFIQKGNPYGHAVIVVDVAKNEQNEKLFMIAQSYMPAQETQILVNRNDSKISPWYKATEGTIYTPEWTFKSTDLRRFKD
ncbi:DUF4846 domain-containing protein [Kordia zhangzhouensis]|uniref:DUF4846 domain-containing protein n=1 Tax=Kordia zhangzhouensis TaxID=1620405 RepID=UPI00069A59E0|nr:DUF4846 domain-containing protein [Kordia zhangzhouensis]